MTAANMWGWDGWFGGAGGMFLLVIFVEQAGAEQCQAQVQLS